MLLRRTHAHTHMHSRHADAALKVVMPGILTELWRRPRTGVDASKQAVVPRFQAVTDVFGTAVEHLQKRAAFQGQWPDVELVQTWQELDEVSWPVPIAQLPDTVKGEGRQLHPFQHPGLLASSVLPCMWQL